MWILLMSRLNASVMMNIADTPGTDRIVVADGDFPFGVRFYKGDIKVIEDQSLPRASIIVDPPGPKTFQCG